MAVVYERPRALADVQTHYCPGCTHGLIHRLIAEVMDELDIEGETIGVAPVGCSVFAYNYFNCDMIQAPHGRAPAVATGIKRARGDSVVFTYQGDGDLAAIGTAEMIHTATRGEHITIFFINNAIYGMTGGQMAPTTLVGQRSTTSQSGRTVEQAGAPMRVSELISAVDGAVYVERVALNSPQNIIKAKKAIRRAFDVQESKLGFSMVEFLSTCPTNWGLPPLEAIDYLNEKMLPYYPLGVYKSPEGGEK